MSWKQGSGLLFELSLLFLPSRWCYKVYLAGNAESKKFFQLGEFLIFTIILVGLAKVCQLP